MSCTFTVEKTNEDQVIEQEVCATDDQSSGLFRRKINKERSMELATNIITSLIVIKHNQIDNTEDQKEKEILMQELNNLLIEKSQLYEQEIIKKILSVYVKEIRNYYQG